MNNENTSRPSVLDRTLRPGLVREQAARSEGLTAPRMQMQQRQQQAGGITCPYCGAVNEPEAIFCAQCGQPVRKMACPHCGAEVDPDADLCEVCHHYIKNDVCSFCGASMKGGDVYCPECGSPRGGVVCPTCNTLNDFAFCKKCGTALTAEAKQMVKELQKNPDYQELLEIVHDFSQLENALPYTSERDVEREEKSQQLRQRVLMLLAKDEGVEEPVIPAVESKRMTKEELTAQKAVKAKMLAAILDKLSVKPMASPVKARNYAMAAKPQGVRLAWVCNWKHAMHSSPCGCAKPHLGGKWIILGQNMTAEIKDDK